MNSSRESAAREQWMADAAAEIADAFIDDGLKEATATVSADIIARHYAAREREVQELQRFWDEHSVWSQATFGTDAERGPIGPLKHLEKEAREAQAQPDDLEEFADCLFLTFDAARRAGFTLAQLTEAAFAKLEKNKRREWGPRTKDGAVEHIRMAAQGEQHD